MAAFVKGNPEVDFFEQNQELRYIREVKELIKTHGETLAGRLMWAVYLVEDPNSSLYKMPLEEREVEVAEVYLDDPEFDWSILDDIRSRYGKLILSKEEFLFKIWADKLDEGMTYIKKLQFEDSATKIVALMEKIGKAWDQYDKAKKKMIETQKKDNIRGGGQKSFREMRQKAGR
jgi:hypothetical protein